MNTNRLYNKTPFINEIIHICTLEEHRLLVSRSHARVDLLGPGQSGETEVSIPMCTIELGDARPHVLNTVWPHPLGDRPRSENSYQDSLCVPTLIYVNVLMEASKNSPPNRIDEKPSYAIPSQYKVQKTINTIIILQAARCISGCFRT